MSTHTNVQVTDFTFSDEKGGSLFLSLFFFYMEKVKENRESAKGVKNGPSSGYGPSFFYHDAR